MHISWYSWWILSWFGVSKHCCLHLYQLMIVHWEYCSESHLILNFCIVYGCYDEINYNSTDLCPYQWCEQPSNQALSCDPQGAHIRMKCSVCSVESVSVSWFMTQDVYDAGFAGYEITNGGPFDISPSSTKDNISFTSLFFQASNCTFGYYWCEINFPPVNMIPSSVVAVIPNISLPLCNITRPYDPPSNTNKECAVKGFSGSETTTHYPTSPTKYSVSPSTTVSKVLLSKHEMLWWYIYIYIFGVFSLVKYDGRRLHKSIILILDVATSLYHLNTYHCWNLTGTNPACWTSHHMHNLCEQRWLNWSAN